MEGKIDQTALAELFTRFDANTVVMRVLSSYLSSAVLTTRITHHDGVISLRMRVRHACVTAFLLRNNDMSKFLEQGHTRLVFSDGVIEYDNGTLITPSAPTWELPAEIAALCFTEIRLAQTKQQEPELVVFFADYPTSAPLYIDRSTVRELCYLRLHNEISCESPITCVDDSHIEIIKDCLARRSLFALSRGSGESVRIVMAVLRELGVSFAM